MSTKKKSSKHIFRLLLFLFRTQRKNLSPCSGKSFLWECYPARYIKLEWFNTISYLISLCFFLFSRWLTVNRVLWMRNFYRLSRLVARVDWWQSKWKASKHFKVCTFITYLFDTLVRYFFQKKSRQHSEYRKENHLFRIWESSMNVRRFGWIRPEWGYAIAPCCDLLSLGG